MRRWSIICGLAIIMTACQPYPPPSLDPQQYPRHYQFYDLAFSWKTDRRPDTFSIEGFVRNNRYAYLRDLELTATLLDNEGKELAATTFYFIPNQLAIDERAPFTLAIPLKPDQNPARLKFFYRYRLAEKGYQQTPYFYSFTTDLY